MQGVTHLFPVIMAAMVFSAVWLMFSFLLPERPVRVVTALIALVPVPTALLYLAMFHGLGAPGVSSPWLDHACQIIFIDGAVILAIGILAVLRK
ncbi:MAG: hypothetical protein QM796_14775 [Chthoniobacteraceae bacterium]